MSDEQGMLHWMVTVKTDLPLLKNLVSWSTTIYSPGSHRAYLTLTFSYSFRRTVRCRISCTSNCLQSSYSTVQQKRTPIQGSEFSAPYLEKAMSEIDKPSLVQPFSALVFSQLLVSMKITRILKPKLIFTSQS